MWAFFAFLVLEVLGALLAKKPPSPTPSALGQFTTPTAEPGRPLQIGYGTCYYKGANCTWYGDLGVSAITVESGGFFGLFTTKQTVGYKYYLGMQLAICKGLTAWEMQNGSGLQSVTYQDNVIDTTNLSATGLPLNSDLLNKVGADRTTVINGLPIGPQGTGPDDTFLRMYMNSPDLLGGDQSEGGIQGVMDFYYGVSQQPANDYLAAQLKTPVPAYRGICHAVLRHCYLGTSNYIKDLGFVIARFPWPFADVSVNRWNLNGDANPAAMLYELLTNREWGVGMTDAQLGDSFANCAVTLASEGIGLSLIIDQADSANNVITNILQHIDGNIYTDLTTGLLELMLVRKDYDVNTLPVFDTTNVMSCEIQQPGWADTVNTVYVNYIDRANLYSPGTVSDDNVANIQIQGGVKASQTFDLHGFSTSTNAVWGASRILRSMSYPFRTVTLHTNRAPFQLHVGSVFRLNWAPAGQSIVCRVQTMNYGSLDDSHIEITAIEDVFSVEAAVFTTIPGTIWTNPVDALEPNPEELLLEVPFQLIGGQSRNVMILATRANSQTLGYEVWSDPGQSGVFNKTNTSQVFTPAGTLATSYPRNRPATDHTVGITVIPTRDMAMINAVDAQSMKAGKNLMMIGTQDAQEFLAWQDFHVNPDGSYTFTGILGGILDTIPLDHAQGATVWFVSDGTALVNPSGNYGTDLAFNVKLLPYISGQTLDITKAQADTVTTASRAWRPYPAANLQANGVRYAQTTTGDLTFTWAIRDRVAQLAAGQVYADDESSVVGEAEGAYALNVSINGATVFTTNTTGTSYTLTAAQRSTWGAGAVQFSITATNPGGFTSLVREADPVTMTGFGMAFGEFFGGFVS